MKRKSFGEGNIHDFHIDDEWTGNFIVLGTTGSGKTTLIRYMTEAKFEGLSQGGQFRISVDSVTQESKVYKTGRIKMHDTSVTLKFRDTVGFGAKDMASKTILKDTFLDVVGDFDKIRGCVLVHKCERHREGGAQDLEQIKQMLDTMGLNIGKHLLIVITHTGHLSEETQETYTADIRKKVLEDVPEDRVIHVNFANLSELNEHHRCASSLQNFSFILFLSLQSFEPLPRFGFLIHDESPTPPSQRQLLNAHTRDDLKSFQSLLRFGFLIHD